MVRPFKLAVLDLRLGEFDLGGVLYHAHYYHLYEMAREACLREHGVPYSDLVAEQMHLAIVEASQKFRAPIRYGDPLDVELSFDEIGRANVRALYRITVRGTDSPIEVHEGWTRLACIVNADGRFKPSRFPEKLLSIFKTFSCEPAR